MSADIPSRSAGQRTPPVDVDADWQIWLEVERADRAVASRHLRATMPGGAPQYVSPTAAAPGGDTGGIIAADRVREVASRGVLPARPDLAPSGMNSVAAASAQSVQRSANMGTARMARVVAVVCVLVAIGAMAAGKPVVALALAGGASWLALRRGHRLYDTAEYQTAERSIRDASR